MSLLRVEGLSKSFGGVTAAKAVTFAVEAGRLLAIIGPNGAGKSTIFNMVGGQLAPDAGRVLLDGRDITGLAARRVWRLGVSRTFQIAQTFHSMTVAENVQMAVISRQGRMRAWWPEARPLYRGEALVLLERMGMREQADRPCSELAYGDVKRVELAVALAGAPKLLLMDEPTAGMAPGERAELMRLTADVARERSIGILFTEHDMDAVFAYADSIIVLVRGRIISAGPPEAVRADPQVQRAYLGGEAADAGQRRGSAPAHGVAVGGAEKGAEGENP
jgi:branched-chain amino acid transport system ATP-binding protein